MTSRILTSEQRAELDALAAVTRRLVPSLAMTRSLTAERDASVLRCLKLGIEKTAIAERGQLARQTVHKRAQSIEGASE